MCGVREQISYPRADQLSTVQRILALPSVRRATSLRLVRVRLCLLHYGCRLVVFGARARAPMHALNARTARKDAPRAAQSSLTVWPLGAIVEFGATRGA